MKTEGRGDAQLDATMPATAFDVGGEPALGEPSPPAPQSFVEPQLTEEPVVSANVPAAAALLAAKGLAAVPDPEFVPAPTPTRQGSSATPIAAILMIMGAVLCFTLLDSTAKMLVLADAPFGALVGAGATAALFVVWARLAVHAALYGVVSGVLHKRPIMRANSWPLQIIRALCLSGATMFNFAALQYLQLAETVAIFFVAPLVVTALAGPMLGEWVGWRRWLAIVGGFIGVLVMARPGTSIFQPALALSVLSMLSYSMYMLMTRMLANRETPESLVFISAFVPMVLLTPALIWNWTPPTTLPQLVLVLTLGVYGLVGHFLFVRAYKLASTGALAPYTYVQIPFMVLFGWVLFGDLPDGPTLLGISIIACAGLYILLRERQLAREERAALAGK